MIRLASTILLLLVACNQEDQEPANTPPPTPTTQEGLPAGHPPIGPSSSASTDAVATASQRQVMGTVAETMDAAGYTYLLLDTPDGQQWAAVTQTSVQVGQTVTLTGAAAMAGFHSKALDRTFDSILFAELASNGATASSAAAATLPDSQLPVAEGIDKAAGADARTIAEVFAQGEVLSGKPVAVRGKVVKFSPNIMGANWVHLRDGTGTDAGGDNDLTLTISDTVAVGDVVTVRGLVATDKDFGAGYAYDVIVEKGTVLP